jgi:hypothetical protein
MKERKKTKTKSMLKLKLISRNKKKVLYEKKSF